MSEKDFDYECSVVIPIYNGARFIDDLVNSLCKQTFAHDKFQVVFVDNLSDDQTPTLLLEAKERLEKHKIQAEILREELERTPSAARNTGIRWAIGQSKIITFIDVDVVPSIEWLSHIVNGFVDEYVAVVAGGIGSYRGKSMTVFEEYAERVNRLSQEGPLNHHYLPFAQTANMAVRREVFLRIGLFRTKLSSGEDADFCWRMIKEMKLRILYVENAKVVHKHRSTFRELCKQYYWHAAGAKILSCLYPSSAKPHFSWIRASRLTTRFVFYDLPAFVILLFFARAKVVDLIYAPLSLFLMIISQRSFDKTIFLEKGLEIPYLLSDA